MADHGSESLARWLVSGLVAGAVILGLLIGAYAIGYHRGQHHAAQATAASAPPPTTTAPATTTAPTTSGPVTATPALVARGKQLFASDGCVGCHSLSGASGAGPSLEGLAGGTVKLTSGKTVTADDAYLVRSIVDPDAEIVSGYKPGIMSAAVAGFGLASKPADVEALAAFVKSRGCPAGKARPGALVSPFVAVGTEARQRLHRSGTLGVSHGAALYLGSLIGPGVLLVPALALQAAGPASVIGWAALLVLSAPLALTFAALGARLPVAGGVAAYVRAGFGDAGGAVTGGWFLTAVLLGAPAVSLIGGFYVADLTGGGRGVAAAVGLGMFAVVLLANALGLRLSSRFQLLLAAVLTLVIATAVAVALPSQGGRNWTPFAPHGWWAVGTAANVLVWLFVGWEAVAQLAGEFREPATQLPRAMAVAFGAVTILYVGLAVATVGVSSGSSRVPLADLIGVGFGARGRDATAVLAVALTMGTMNVYLGGAAKLAAAQAERGALPSWLAGDAHRSIPRRPLAVIALIGMLLLGALVAGLGSADGLVRATSACFIAVYVAATASATRILAGAARAAALTAFVLVAVLAVFSAWFLLVPIVSAGVSAALRARLRGRVPEQAASADEPG